MNRDKASPRCLLVRDESLEESDNLPHLRFLSQKIIEHLEAALDPCNFLNA
jgi:hypothetical protein